MMSDQKKEIVEKIRRHMQTAMMIELSTLPPYLCAYWSIHGTSAAAGNVKKYLLSVIREEMLHMGMACNILNAVGGNPILNDPLLHPAFPCPLPGHSRTNNAFTVDLNKCCPHAIETFLRIEMPEEFFGTKHHEDGWSTIGEFYCEIESLIKHDALDDSDFGHGRQIGNNFNPAKGILYKVTNRADALNALEEIIDQGEGHSGKMYDRDHELTHYWKFRAVLDLMEGGLWNYNDEVYDMSMNPDFSFFSEEAKKASHQFNVAWSCLLDEMHAAFNSPAPSLDASINLMFPLQKAAVALMQIPLLNGAGNAGPTFSYIAKGERV